MRPSAALFSEGIFEPDAVGNEPAVELLNGGTDRADGVVHPTHFLGEALINGGPRVVTTLARALPPGVTTRDVIQLIELCHPPRIGPPTFDGRRERFSPEALAALDQFEAGLRDGGDIGADMAVELLLACLLDNLEPAEKQTLDVVDVERASAVFMQAYRVAIEPLLPLFDAASGRLRSDEFTEAAWGVLEQAAERASDIGYERLLPPHCLLALLSETEGVADHLVRLQASPEAGPGEVVRHITDSFRLGERRTTVELTRDDVGEAMVAVLRAAQREARLWEAEQVDSGHLIAGLLDQLPSRLQSALVRPPLGFDLARMRRQLADVLREARSTGHREVAFRLPTGTLPSDDLTYRVRTQGLPEALHASEHVEAMTRALFRREYNHVLVTGSRGVGKTTLIHELARRAGTGDIAFLGRKRVLWVDCATVEPSQSKEKLGAALAHVAGRTDVILCLDGLGPILRSESGGHNKVLLRAALKAHGLQLIGVMSETDYEDLLSSDHELLEFFTRVSVSEPERDDAVDMVRHACAELSEQYELAIDEATIRRAVLLADDYILSERLPAKAIKIFQRACEDLDYERKQRGSATDAITIETVNRVVSDLSGIPEATVAGTVGEVNYERELGSLVVGQPAAVSVVASQLEAIKAGLPEPGKPASVMLFAGLTGVGKTELAKILAQLYSSSKRLQTYTMANFTEPHSVSGIVGVPPGYVGHEQGGRLINDLNADPYCVFLLDEAEKAHPDVWKPFLNLFDEGWIVDQRAVKAFANRAIFILTTNAGSELIAQKAQAGVPDQQIALAVKEALSNVRHQRTDQPVFPPEFLARIQQIVVFRPLDEEAKRDICRMAVARIADDWSAKRGRELIVPDSLVTYVAREAHTADVRADYKEGGRIVRRLLNELLRDRVLAAAKAHKEEFAACNVIELQFLAPGPALPHEPAPAPKVVVEFRREPAPTTTECVARTAAELRRAADEAVRSGEDLSRLATASLLRMERALAQADGADPSVVAAVTGPFRAAVEELGQLRESTQADAVRLVERLATSLEASVPAAQR